MTKPLDLLAVRIGEAYRRGLVAHAEAGKLLADRKSTLKHGEWLDWLKANAEPLGHISERTAQRLMKLAGENPTLASDLTDTKALTQRLWGKSPTPDAMTEPGLEPQQSFEWYTPPEYVALVKAVFGGEIDLDVASCREANTRWVKARKFYSREQDGLTLPWKGRVYANPPFQSVYMAPFVDKLIAERANGNCTEAILLSNGATDSPWFQKLLHHAPAICFPRGRVKYIRPGDSKPSGSPEFGSAFSYFGTNTKQFAVGFRGLGAVVKAL